MTQKLARLFSPGDLERISAAVQAAEGQTSGEIVPYVCERSDDYEVALWRAGFALSALVGASLFMLQRFTTVWLPFNFIQSLFMIFLAHGLGMLLALVMPSLKRFFAGENLLQRTVEHEARAAFLAEEVFKTRERTGILLFLSLFERKVVVLGDAGINAKVTQAEWQEVVHIIVFSMHTKQPAQGLINAIHKCGELLQKQGVLRRADDSDELANSLRLKGERA